MDNRQTFRGSRCSTAKITMCDIKAINSVTNTDLGKHSHMILHRFVEEDHYKCYKLKFASNYVENEVFKTIDANQRSDLMSFLRTSKGNPLFSVLTIV